MILPESNELPVNHLAACFNNTTSTYKFYWLLSILQAVEEGNLHVSKRDLFSRMISNAWFTVNYFHVSFGKQDLIQQAIEAINEFEKIPIDENRQLVFQKLSSTTNKETVSKLWHFNKNVPHWFLSPWFPKTKNETEAQQAKRIYSDSKHFNEKCLYALYDDSISINSKWNYYLTENARVLKDFCYWNLALFLQAKNPNVPDIPNKLIKPAIRNNLTKQRNEYWKHVFDNEEYIECIFTTTKLVYNEKNFDIDHFVPHGFVSHDLIWNLIPIEKKYNSSKCDKLPLLDKHFNKFYDLQKKAFNINLSKNPQSKYIEEFLTIFPDLDKSFPKEKFRETIQPLITIASNNGFEFLK